MRVVRGRFLRWLIFSYPYIIYLPFNLKIIVIYVSLLGILIGYLVSNIKIYSLNKFLSTYTLRNFLRLIWFMPNLSTYGLRYNFLNFGQNLLKIVDIGWREIYRGQGIFLILKKYSIFYYFYQINNFKIYLFRFVLWIVIILFILFIYLNSLYIEHNIEDIKEIFNL
jgi:NADH-ubiquinone oxidoreductase chain 5